MKFNYRRVGSLKETLEILSEGDESLKILAGGTDLLVMIQEKLISPGVLLDISGLEELKGIDFSVAFIDGWHWDDEPLNDWNNVKEVTSKYVVFDNYDGRHPAIDEACLKADNDKDWDTFSQNHICYILKKKGER